MSGVIDDDGQQWERCNGCGEFCRIERLHYEKPSQQFEYGRDLCPACTLATPLPTEKGQTVTIYLG